MNVTPSHCGVPVQSELRRLKATAFSRPFYLDADQEADEDNAKPGVTCR